MAWSGGSFTRANPTWVSDAGNGIGIEAGRHDAQDNDFTTGINQCLNKDGSNSATGNLNLGGYLPTNIGAGTAAAPAICAGNDVNTGIFSPAADQIGIATNGTERVRIDASGNLGIGTTAPGSKLDVQGVTETEVKITEFGANASGPYLALQKSRGASVGTNTIVADGDEVGVFIARGANGSGYTAAGAIGIVVDGTPGASNDMPGRIVFSTTPNATGTPTEKYRITNNGILRGASNALVEVSRANATAATSGGCYKLQIDGIDHAAIATSGSEACTIYTGVGTLSQRIRFAANDFAIFNFGTGAGTHTMKYNNSTGAWTHDTSSLRYKKNVADSPYGLNAALQLKPRVFNYKDTNKPDVGFIAEEVFPIIPELVALNLEGLPDAISYDRLTSVLCKAIQELNAKVEALEARVAELEP